MSEKVESKTVVLTRVGTDFWSRPVYKVGDYDAYVKDIELGRFDEPSLYWSCPKSDPDGEPDTPFRVKEGVEIIIKDFKEKPLTRDDKKLILARMIAANEYVEGKRSVEWVDFASSIKDIELTKELLQELKENPMELVWTPDRGYVIAGTENQSNDKGE